MRYPPLKFSSPDIRQRGLFPCPPTAEPPSVSGRTTRTVRCWGLGRALDEKKPERNRRGGSTNKGGVQEGDQKTTLHTRGRRQTTNGPPTPAVSSPRAYAIVQQRRHSEGFACMRTPDPVWKQNTPKHGGRNQIHLRGGDLATTNAKLGATT